MKKTGISFVFPMYNERDNIGKTVSRAKRLAEKLTSDYEIIIADDASTDGSGDMVDDLAKKDPKIRSVRLQKNTKFGGALNAGLLAAQKPVVIYTDSDFPAGEEDIQNALALLKDSDIVTAYSLVIKDIRFKRILLSKGYNFLVRLLFGLRLRDINSGLKIYKLETINKNGYRSRSPFIDVEIFIEAIKNGYRIKQYGVIFDLRKGGTSAIARFSVITKTLLDMLIYRIFP